MASNNRDPFLGSAGVGDSPFERHARRIGNMVVDLMDYSGRIGEDRAHARSGPIIAELEARLNASEAGAAWARADVSQAKTDADVRIAQYTSDLETRNAQMVKTVAETVERLKRDAAARVAAAETHAQDCINETRYETDSQIRQLSRDLDRHVDMLGLARKHTGWVAHKLLRLLIELKEKKRFPNNELLVHCLNEMFEELAEFRNDCDVFLVNGLVDDGGALPNRTYHNSSGVTSPGNTGEQATQTQTSSSPYVANATNKHANREESSLFMDEQRSDRSDRSYSIKSEDGDMNQQLGASTSGLGQLEQGHTDVSPPTKRASDCEGQAGHGGKVSEQSSGGDGRAEHTLYNPRTVDGVLIWEIGSLDSKSEKR
ncbi:hypothetical protein NOF04DRAFT_11309 [Fusarium oxysporum II5]|uniref:Uncharacterized protein n=1 Tax=Fusarium odoratissimum (strain NRRL 54006) TaxID=1089451 RepID=X0JEF8_FUSO5|nr:uncharacterized protein FOIG_12570 [Fusarium odoratissimum NRRL 54006]EXL94725.1 hypothetical protein FOIG_12570 [Fusarium odoratissimum NRRL 54006]KAK2128834.1 hypothetical protein NOF04DRAFT_11309 [Fusarium oxysporum II5]